MESTVLVLKCKKNRRTTQKLSTPRTKVDQKDGTNADSVSQRASRVSRGPNRENSGLRGLERNR